MEHGRHVLRVLFVFVIAIASLAIGRQFLVPPSYGLHGDYRAANVQEQMDRPVRHQGDESCKKCHEEQYAAREEGEVHLSVRCESCHGPGALHANATDKIADMPVDHSVKLCARCHRDFAGRPKDISLISLDDPKHFKGEKIADGVCEKCHNPHSTFFEET